MVSCCADLRPYTRRLTRGDAEDARAWLCGRLREGVAEEERAIDEAVSTSGDPAGAFVVAPPALARLPTPLLHLLMRSSESALSFLHFTQLLQRATGRPTQRRWLAVSSASGRHRRSWQIWEPTQSASPVRRDIGLVWWFGLELTPAAVEASLREPDCLTSRLLQAVGGRRTDERSGASARGALDAVRQCRGGPPRAHPIGRRLPPRSRGARFYRVPSLVPRPLCCSHCTRPDA